MRLFHDGYSSRNHTHGLLLFADVVAISAAVVFASGLRTAGGAAALWIALWALLPRCIARYLHWLQGRSALSASLAHGTACGLLIMVLTYCGLQLVVAPAQHGVSAGPAILFILFGAWAVGFFLFLPRVYVVHDALILTLLLAGALERRPEPYLWIPLALAGVMLSCALRLVLHGGIAPAESRWVNLQPARAAGLAGGALVGLLFVALWLPLQWFEAETFVDPGASRGVAGLSTAGNEAELERGSGSSRGGDPGPWGRSVAGSGGPAGNPSQPGADDRARSPGGADTSTRDGTGGTGDTHGTGDDAASAGGSDTPLGREDIIGFADSVQLSDLTPAREDPRPVFCVRATATRRDQRPQRRWQPTAATLWKVATLVRYDARSEVWHRDAPADDPVWLRVEGVPLPAAPTAGSAESLVRLEVELLASLLPSMVHPYHTTRLGPFAGSGAPAEFRRNRDGDVISTPPIARGMRYQLRITPRDPYRWSWPSSQGTHTDPRYLAVPDARALGFDAEALARRIFKGRRSNADKLIALRHYLARSFRYEVNGQSSAQHQRLRRFLEEERAGSCAYFASASALLLRAGGVSTRIVSGFAGAQWDTQRQAWVILNGSAHAWIEVYFPGRGWLPVDPTTWVPTDRRDPSALSHHELPPDPGLAGAQPATGDDAEPDVVDPAVAERPASEPRSTTDPSMAEPSGPSGPSGPSATSATSTPSPADIEARATAATATGSRPPSPARRRGESGSRETPGGRSATSATRERSDDLPFDHAGIDETLPHTTQDHTGSATSPGFAAVFARLLLVLIGGLVVLGTVMTFLRPGHAPDETEGEVGDDDGPLHPLGGPALARPDFAPRNPAEQVLLEYHRLQLSLRNVRRHRLCGETPREHAERFSGRDPQLDNALEELVASVYGALYGAGSLDHEAVQSARRQARTTRRLLGGSDRLFVTQSEG